jgi:hypothetical protein
MLDTQWKDLIAKDLAKEKNKAGKKSVKEESEGNDGTSHM